MTEKNEIATAFFNACDDNPMAHYNAASFAAGYRSRDAEIDSMLKMIESQASQLRKIDEAVPWAGSGRSRVEYIQHLVDRNNSLQAVVTQ